MGQMKFNLEEYPKKLRKTLKRFVQEEGATVNLVLPALPRRHMDERSLAMIRLGMFDESKISSWLVTTDEDLIFIKIGFIKNRVERFPLDSISDVEYVREFQDNTLKIIIGDAAEVVRFYDERDGIVFYQFMKNKSWNTE